MRIDKYQLYVILDRKSQKERDFLDVAQAAIKGGADIIQLRDKELSTKELIEQGILLRKLTHQSGTGLIINDRVDIALAVEADGVHLGGDDLPLSTARRILGSRYLIGRSTHTIEQAFKAQQEGADYIGVGPIFATPTKPTYKAVGVELIAEVASKIKIPFAAIGGIDITNVNQVLEKGATTIAVVRAVVGAENVERAARVLKTAICQLQSQEQLL